MMPLPEPIRRVSTILFLAASSIVDSTSIAMATTSMTATSTTPRPNLRRPHQQMSKSDAQFGLVVPHCKEDMSWIDQVDDITLDQETTTWDPVVYERCKQDASPDNYSTWQRNMGHEECSGYLKYIITRYDKLPEVVYFLQPDSLTWKEAKGHQHTSFTTLQELVATSAPLLKGEGDTAPLGYLNLGNESTQPAKIFTPKGPGNNPSEIFDYMKERAPLYNQEGEGSRLVYVPGASFAVRREQILAHPAEFYKDLLLDVMKHPDARWTCWSLEASWHVIFGEPLVMSDQARLMHHLEMQA